MEIPCNLLCEAKKFEVTELFYKYELYLIHF